MADQIGYLTFTDVSLSNGTVTGSFSNTTVEIDYTTNQVVSVINGPLTFTVGGQTTTFSPLSLTSSNGTYSLYSGSIQDPGIRLQWSGTSPHGFSAGVVFVSTPSGNIFDTFVVNKIEPVICFAAGTLIRTPAGEVAVETLKAGDLVLTASGQTRPVKWIGHADVDFRRTPRGSPGLPVRIAADAFGPARPSQDLYLSAGHSVCVDLLGEVLIPVGHLINGGTIAEIDTDWISYWHVELDSHDILIANNLPAESYLAMANRGAFEELRGLLPARVEGSERTHADFCRPVITEGPTLDFVRQRLAARAEEIGWKTERDADLHLMVDGRIVRPLAEDGSAAFLFRADAKDVRLLSNTFTPMALGTSDLRRLGVMLLGLALSGSGGEPRRISLDDDRLRDGVHPVEDHGGALRRWTTGEFVLDPRLWEGLSGQIALHVLYDHKTVRGWTAAPARAKSFDAVDRPKLYAVS
jgi:Hint domain